MINPFILKKWGALLLTGLMTTIFFAVGVVFYNFYIGLALMAAGLITSVIAANLMLKTPFSDMLEGKGILAIDINSTGILQPFIVAVQSPFIRARVKGKVIEDVFNRKTVNQIKPALKKPGKVSVTNGKVSFELSQEEFNDARMAMYQYPVIFFNSQLGTVITKEFLSTQEKEAFAEHQLIYLNHKNQELSSLIRDFARHVINELKPQGNLLANKWLWLAVGALIIILIVLFAPAVLDAIGGFSSSGAGQAIASAQDATQSVTVR